MPDIFIPPDAEIIRVFPCKISSHLDEKQKRYDDVLVGAFSAPLSLNWVKLHQTSGTGAGRLFNSALL